VKPAQHRICLVFIKLSQLRLCSNSRQALVEGFPHPLAANGLALLTFLAHIYSVLLLLNSSVMMVVLIASAIGIVVWMLRRFVRMVAASAHLAEKPRRRTRRVDQWNMDHPLFSKRAGQ
jgi:hypothetical protein